MWRLSHTHRMAVCLAVALLWTRACGVAQAATAWEGNVSEVMARQQVVSAALTEAGAARQRRVESLIGQLMPVPFEAPPATSQSPNEQPPAVAPLAVDRRHTIVLAHESPAPMPHRPKATAVVTPNAPESPLQPDHSDGVSLAPGELEATTARSEKTPKRVTMMEQDSPAEDRYYQVRRGDSLWAITGTLLGEPTRWPEVWDANPQIANPHLIYPGQRIDLSSWPVSRTSGAALLAVDPQPPAPMVTGSNAVAARLTPTTTSSFAHPLTVAARPPNGAPLLANMACGTKVSDLPCVRGLAPVAWTHGTVPSPDQNTSKHDASPRGAWAAGLRLALNETHHRPLIFSRLFSVRPSGRVGASHRF